MIKCNIHLEFAIIFFFQVSFRKIVQIDKENNFKIKKITATYFYFNTTQTSLPAL